MCMELLLLAVFLLGFADTPSGGPDSPGISRALRHRESLDALTDDADPDAGGDSP